MKWLRTHPWMLLVSLGTLMAAAVGLYVHQGTWQTPGPAMEPAQAAYWQWVRSLNQGTADVLAEGEDLLRENPELRLLYLRLAQVCRTADAVASCERLFADLTPEDPLTMLYRAAAQALLLEDMTSDEAVVRWQTLAHAPDLDPTLARLVVDQAPRESTSWFEVTKGWWRYRLDEDSTAAGAAFGLGYVAMRRQVWDEAEALLTQVTRLLPNDPHAYRELGNLYHVTSQPARFEAVLTAGIAAARTQHDLEQELILSSTLGWGLAQRSGDLVRGEQRLREALARSRTLSDVVTEGQSLYRLAWISHAQHRYDETLVLLDAATACYEKTNRQRTHPEIAALRGLALSRLFRFSDAERALETAIHEAEAAHDQVVHIQATASLAELQYRMGRYRSARETGYATLELAQQYRTVDQEIAARMVLGEVEQQWSNLEAAIEHLEQGLARAQQTKNEPRIRELYARLGRAALTLGDVNRAQTYFEAMLQRRAASGDAASQATAYLGLGRTYQEYRNTEQALHYFDESLAALPRTGHAPLRAEILIAKAWTLIDRRDLSEATALLQQAEPLASEDPRHAYQLALALGTIALEQHDYEQALQHFRDAEALEEAWERSAQQWQVAFGKALASWRLGAVARAEAAFRASINHIEATRESITQTANRSYYIQNKVQVYKYFAAFLEAQGRNAEAFDFSERARSRSLVDLLYTTQQENKHDAARPADEIIELNRRMRALMTELTDVSQAAAADPLSYASTREAQLLRAYEATAAQYEALQNTLARSRPIYTFETLSADSVRFTLAHREAMVVYDLRTFDEVANIAAFVILPNEIIRLDLHPRENLTESIRFFRGHLRAADGTPGSDWEAVSRKLYQDLMRPVVDVLPGWVNHLHIVPEGALNYLPFAALLSPRGRFLVEDYALSVVPSASTLKLARDQNPGRWRSMLLFADPDGRLPGSRREVLALEAQSPNRRHAFVGAEATQATLEELAGQYDILHFATHGRFVSQAPWRSHLELHNDPLNVEEIGRLNLDAYLVTLSACETALGGGLVADVPSGDEWIGLNQAFLAAGTPTVMASLWPIDDRVSSTFMIDFYEALGPRGKGVALAEVQRRFIASKTRQHPFYWAAFTIIGDPL